MDIQHAIAWQMSFKATYGDYLKETTEATDIAIQALKKQIPKIPVGVRVGANTIVDGCPGCGNAICVKGDYCPNCGQAISWEDAND